MLAKRWLAVASAAVLLACGGGVSKEESVDAASLASFSQREALPEPMGTFDNPEPQAGDLVKLVLLSDSRFHAEQVVWCITTPCDPIEQNGTYESFVMGGRRYLALYDGEGVLVQSYEYQFDGERLDLRDFAAPEWQALSPSLTAWCGELQDCKLQGLFTPACEGHWACEESVCDYHIEPDGALY